MPLVDLKVDKKVERMEMRVAAKMVDWKERLLVDVMELKRVASKDVQLVEYLDDLKAVQKESKTVAMMELRMAVWLAENLEHWKVAWKGWRRDTQ